MRFFFEPASDDLERCHAYIMLMTLWLPPTHYNKTAPIGQNNELISKQYSVRCYLQDHPNNEIVNDAQSPRSIRNNHEKPVVQN